MPGEPRQLRDVPPLDTPMGYPSEIVGQKRRNAPPMTHDHAERRFQAPFRARTGEMSAEPLAPAETWPLLTPLG